jgi:hypothetical protein
LRRTTSAPRPISAAGQLRAPRGERGEQAQRDHRHPHARAEGTFEPQHAQPGEHEQHQRDDGRFQDLPGRAEHADRLRPARRDAVRGQVRDEIGQEARRPQAPRRDHHIEDDGPGGLLLPRVAQQQQQGAEAGDAAVDPLPQQRRHFLRRRVRTRLVHVHGDTLDHALR